MTNKKLLERHLAAIANALAKDAEALRLADQLSEAVVDNYETGDWVPLLDKASAYRKARGLE